MVTGETVPEIAERYGRSERTIEHWQQNYGWPAPVGKRGRMLAYDQGEVDAAVRAILALGDQDADPDELLDTKAAAAEAGLSYGTVRAYISRGEWPAPDDETWGRRWKRSTVRAEMARRKPDARRRKRFEGGA
jgi:transposase